VLCFSVRSADALNVSILGRRDWTREQGCANAALLLLARAMHADFVEPVNEKEYGAVLGRTQGCAFELRVSHARRDEAAVLVLTVRHYHAQATWHLDGEGLEPPRLDPDLILAAVEASCRTFATQQ
jgi:hypothetical protein